MDIISDENIIKLNHGGRTLSYEDITTTIEAIAGKYNIDLITCKQGQFKGVLNEASNILFRPREVLKDPKNTNNQYDIDIIDKLADCFLQICFIYGNKFPTPYAFSVFSGIPYDTLLNWQEEKHLRSINGYHIKKIINARNEAITDKLYDSNNVTGQAMLANNILGWNTSRSQSQSISISADNIPTLSTELNNILTDSNI